MKRWQALIGGFLGWIDMSLHEAMRTMLQFGLETYLTKLETFLRMFQHKGFGSETFSYQGLRVEVIIQKDLLVILNLALNERDVGCSRGVGQS